MTILALDLSLTATGWAKSLDEFGVCRPGGVRGVERLQILENWLYSRIVDATSAFATPTVDLALIEGYSYAAKGSALFQIAEWGGVARLTLYQHDIPFIEVPPAVLKKYATGRGNATKPDMRMALYKRSGLDVADDNAVDAIWLLAIGRQLVDDPLWEMPKAQVDALGKLEVPEGVL
jgi:Holliday junction resolvasome RuvABC endonuclease subunit